MNRQNAHRPYRRGVPLAGAALIGGGAFAGIFTLGAVTVCAICRMQAQAAARHEQLLGVLGDIEQTLHEKQQSGEEKQQSGE